MIYGSPRESRVPGFDRWYWDLLAMLPKAKKLLLVAGSYDSDGTVREVLDEAKRRGIACSIHFIEGGPLKVAFVEGFSSLATLVPDVETFAEDNGIELDSPGDLAFDF
jgi:hypothetical protein